MTPLSADTQRLVERMIDPARREHVRRSLQERCGTSLPLVGRGTPQSLERIRFAVLKLGTASDHDFDYAVSVANVDWRDVLVAAGFGHSVTAHRVWFEEVTQAR